MVSVCSLMMSKDMVAGGRSWVSHLEPQAQSIESGLEITQLFKLSKPSPVDILPSTNHLPRDPKSNSNWGSSSQRPVAMGTSHSDYQYPKVKYCQMLQDIAHHHLLAKIHRAQARKEHTFSSYSGSH